MNPYVRSHGLRNIALCFRVHMVSIVRKRAFSKTERRTRAQLVAAATELGYSRAQTYVLLNRFLADPRLTSLLPRKRDPAEAVLRCDSKCLVAIA